MIGQTISHYKILEKLGEGGMGVVYKAHDAKLDRTVALKFLPQHVTMDKEKYERLLHEARTTASLNHPNICIIYEINEYASGQTPPETGEEQLYIVMEYVDGVTLKDWMGNHKIKETIGLAAQIADGLYNAHSKGIVHRDIKPENVMITAEDNRVKVMDFGLARLRGSERLTKTGSTVGTPAYMSPEQIQGEDVDHRTDVFSFGIILYEMLSGKRPFQGEHDPALIYEIINVEQQPIEDIDPELNRIISKCLEKEKEDRYQSMADVAIDLRRFLRTYTTGKLQKTGSESTRQNTVPVKSVYQSPYFLGAIAIVIIGILIGAFILLTGDRMTVPVQSRIQQVTFSPGLGDEATWSPDGRFLAYTTDERGKLDIVVQPLTGGEPIWVVESDADDAQPAWSPDGSQIAFVTARNHGGQLAVALAMGLLQEFIKARLGDIYIVPALGGSPVKLVDNGYYPSWSPDGSEIVFQSNRDGNMQLWIISAGGGTPRKLTSQDTYPYHPSWSPDGEWIAYGAGRPPNFGLYVINVNGGNPIKILDEPVISPEWSPDGRSLIYSAGEQGILNLWKVPFKGDSQPGDVTPSRITIGKGADANASSLHSDRKLAFTTMTGYKNIWELTLDDGSLRQITSTTTIEDQPHLSPDGRSLLLFSNRGGEDNLWIYDLEGNTFNRLTRGGMNSQGMWSPDGTRIVFISADGEGTSQIRIQRVDDLSAQEILSKPDIGIVWPNWSPGGRSLAFGMTRQFDDGDIWIYDLDTDELRQLTFLETDNLFQSWSPDGNYIVFSAQEGENRTIWKTPVDGGTPVQLTFGEVDHSHPVWSPVDPDVILFLENHQNICLLRVSTGEIEKITEFRESTTTIDYPSWSPDGEKIYFSKDVKFGDVFVLENY